MIETDEMSFGLVLHDFCITLSWRLHWNSSLNLNFLVSDQKLREPLCHCVREQFKRVIY